MQKKLVHAKCRCAVRQVTVRVCCFRHISSVCQTDKRCAVRQVTVRVCCFRHISSVCQTDKRCAVRQVYSHTCALSLTDAYTHRCIHSHRCAVRQVTVQCVLQCVSDIYAVCVRHVSMQCVSDMYAFISLVSYVGSASTSNASSLHAYQLVLQMCLFL